MTNEKLVEARAKLAQHAMRRDLGAMPKHIRTVLDALAVFEKALGEATVTPTDDEREAITAHIQWLMSIGVRRDHARDAVERLAVALRRSEVPEPSAEEWAERAQAAREKAIAKGYTPEHDAEHGIRHLLNWAIDYARRGRAEESSGMLLSAIALIDGANPGWSTDDRRSADEEAKRRFLEWPAGTGAINGFILGAEWWKLTHPVTPEPQGEPSDAQVLSWLDAEHSMHRVVHHQGEYYIARSEVMRLVKSYLRDALTVGEVR